MHEHRQMHLNCHIVGVGQHPAGWRTLRNTRAIVDPNFYRRVARVAEQGKFDALFFSDSLSLHATLMGRRRCSIRSSSRRRWRSSPNASG